MYFENWGEKLQSSIYKQNWQKSIELKIRVIHRTQNWVFVFIFVFEKHIKTLILNLLCRVKWTQNIITNLQGVPWIRFPLEHFVILSNSVKI